ncbi:MAG: DEAD/DEAH box helicase, partial [Bacteroidota bacterium]
MLEQKTTADILQKLNIRALNPMQQTTHKTIAQTSEVVLLSPTGTGKTLAFLLPILSQLDTEKRAVQAVVIAPSRELAIQIEQVAREMGAGYKIDVVYGGRPFSKDKQRLQHAPALLIGTPGRVADHLRRGTFDIQDIQYLVLDEFDKSLEIGFADEMKTIVQALPHLRKKILTSATQGIVIPDFVRLDEPTYINFLEDGVQQLSIQTILSPDKDKLNTLGIALQQLGQQPGIVFLNYKDSIRRVSNYLLEMNIPHGCFYGGMEQIERERALIKFRNGTHQLLLATDLAARGIDVPDIGFIIHYHLPQQAEAFTHRNGRTARMQRAGTAYVLKWTAEELPDFIDVDGTWQPEEEASPQLPSSPWTTLLVSGGRKDK